MMEPKPIDLYEFLVDSELQHYYNSIKNDLKISMVSHLKYASDEDLKQLGLSKPEIRRLRKYYDKVYPNGYLSKIKRLLQNPVKKDDGTLLHPTVSLETLKVSSSPSKIPNNKHIIPADSICVNKQLGTGEFGIVQQGVWTNGTERIQVAIKCLCRERMQSNPMEFLKEAAIMHSIEHENIVRLYGVVLDTDSLMLVTELAHLRSLLECLKDSGLRVSFLTVPTLCEFAQQICNGMMYLENKRLIHRDLAARNILVFSKNKVKISDFGLSRALGVGKDYYQTNFNINLKLPIAWCAPECINFLRFTNASDVWAFGVCLWEMFSYGFQPWAALTGHQILEAIDEPNYQRLEAPECCPREYYNLMLKCWQHDPLKRPKFTEIYTTLPDMKPEQLKTIQSYSDAKKDHLIYRQNDIISVLDKSSNTPYWKGVLNSGKTGFFNPANTVTYLGSLPSSTNPNRDSFCRTSERSSKRKLRTEMISMPHNDLKHTGHVGLDGAFFGDVANFLSSPNSSQTYNHVPRQIVTPYKPSEDIEQTPLLLPPTPTSPDSLQTASGYFPDNNLTSLSFINAATDNNPTSVDSFGSSFINNDPTGHSNFSSSNPFVNHEHVQQTAMRPAPLSSIGSFNNANVDDDGFYSKDQRKKPTIKWPEIVESSETHEYHEISDDEMTTDKVFDMGPSLLDEMDFMFRSMNAAAAAAASSEQEPKSPGFDNTNKKNEITELTSKLHCRKNAATGVSSTLGMTGKSKKKPGTVKPISHKDERILNQAIDYANEISARSMTDLLTDTPVPAQSPKRKFSFRFPNLSHHSSMDKDSHANGNHLVTGTLTHKGRNFSEEIKNVPDLQRFRSLSEIEKYQSDIRIPLFDKESADFCFEKSCEILSKPFNLDLNEDCEAKKMSQKSRDFIGENLLDIENTLKALNLDFLNAFNELEKTDSAETLFGENNYPYESNVNPKLRNSALKLSKLTHGFNMATKLDFNSPKSVKNLQFSPSDAKQHQQHHYGSSNQFFDVSDKGDDKRSSTPDTGFASRETNVSSRRGSQKSTYSPQESSSRYSPREFNYPSGPIECSASASARAAAYINELAERAHKNRTTSSSPRTVHSSIHSIHSLMHSTPTQNRRLDSEINFPNRKRSMSFTENYDLKSPVLSEPQLNPREIYAPGSGSVRIKTRNVAAYKPRSIKARNLRRLSYNPIVLNSSSSSGSETDFDKSIAHSECDIRSTMSTTRRRRQYLNRKTHINNTSNPDKLYGSNASIKSAPQYSYVSDRQLHKYLDQKFNLLNKCCSNGADGTADASGSSAGLYNGSRSHGSSNVIHPPRGFESETPNAQLAAVVSSYNRNILCSEFDVSKLTGKSPTTQSFLKELFPDVLPITPLSASKTAFKPKESVFQWPEKIHASAVKQNDLLWRQKEAEMKQKTVTTHYSSDSSSTETDPAIVFNRAPEYTKHLPMPPSPAP